MSMAALAPLTRHLPVGRHSGASSAAGVTLTERAFPALAALAVRTDAASRFSERLAAGFGVAAPPVQAAAIASPITVIWTGPDQYLAIDDAHKETERFDFARDLAAQLGDAASVTDVTGARDHRYRWAPSAGFVGETRADRSRRRGFPPGRGGRNARWPPRGAALAAC